ncbi:dolichyl-P-Man:Man(5)GlcNAc(2)-PP-dolichol alpha-1,3-mannosyltransferase [Coemansia sp. RSA 989]|nr:glycosyltransferase [Coemansia mojavensis]KAJ1862370.1 dolichyl-P-Man:Man(5)GlcNAc(2)-PP-dolichol alpha-1,3-mannosyltransferase [Coemansia sp. RSA 989]KAJ1870207.1 dolichyl-P-Man:Man(5)GlcNAc(2)-PP-dolichol alpha-1,3-mannosyltransferase [Coemansia sp. RSA 990]KAJ2669002.1 dolichyl-P-Man:Man(5)GlcNAc(2)-PP-dolichol alpha-1,3-mannosyltransferase [Coemansia sp. RSA 1085]
MLSYLQSHLYTVLISPRYFGLVALAVLVLEAGLNYAIIQHVPYTEIDWRAYMQEVKGVMDGERNYLKLHGDTGPLVYPAGFVWFYGALRIVTGETVRSAQYIFMAVYLATLAIVLAIYKRVQVPPIFLVLLVLSKRLHSIYVLRLFNDTVAMLPAYAAVLAMSSRYMRWSGVLLSTGISIKMNVQLMLPGAAYVWWRTGGARMVIMQLVAVVLVQGIVAMPFLTSYPYEYLARAFEYTRQFDFTWTVNWRFIGQQIFASQEWAKGLLAVHAGLLVTLATTVWPQLSGRSLSAVIAEGFSQRNRHVEAREIAVVMFSANFVGIVCARSLHYQFYSWYAHSLPLLLWYTQLRPAMVLVLWMAVEFAWNVYPSTNLSSLVLLVAHLFITAGIVIRR